MFSRNQPRSIVASRAKVAPFALCLLGHSRGLPARFSLKMIHRIIFRALKSLLPAQALWLFCESAGFVIMMDGVFIAVVIFWYGMLVTIWCAVPFQNFVVIPNVP